jgi:hypothetical protein
VKHTISDCLGRTAVFFWRYPFLRPIALRLASLHKSYHAMLVDRLAAREARQRTLGWWWLSFVDPEKPDGQRFLGVAIVEGSGVASASIKAHELGVNPGGAVKGVPLAGDDLPSVELRNRFLNLDELKKAGLV